MKQLGVFEEDGNGITKCIIKRDLTEMEKEVIQRALYLDRVLSNIEMHKEMVILNGSFFHQFFDKLDDSPTLVRDANILLSTFLNSAKFFIDSTSHIISKIAGKNTKNNFCNDISNVYDQEFSYRFLIRLRNYISHYDSVYKTSSTIECENSKNIYLHVNKSELLRFDGWSKVINEIETLDDHISLHKYIPDFLDAIELIYMQYIYRVLPTIIDDINKYLNWFNKNRHLGKIFVSTYLRDKKSTDIKLNITNLQLNGLISFLKKAKKHPGIDIHFDK